MCHVFFCLCHIQINSLCERWGWRGNPSAVTSCMHPSLGQHDPAALASSNPFQIHSQSRWISNLPQDLAAWCQRACKSQETHISNEMFVSKSTILGIWDGKTNQEMLQISMIIMTRRIKHKCSCEILQTPRERASWKTFPATDRSEAMDLMITPGKLRENNKSMSAHVSYIFHVINQKQ